MNAVRGPLWIDDGLIVAAVRDRLRGGCSADVRVFGGSMAPTIRSGSLVRFVPVEPEDVRVGEVVLVDLGSGLIGHRVVSVANGWVHTRGDSFATPDAPVRAAAVIGRADGLVLGRQRAMPRAVATPINRLLGAAAPLLLRARARTSATLGTRLLRLPGVATLRSALQPFSIEVLDAAWALRARELLLIAGRRPTAPALRAWTEAASRTGGHRAWIAIHGETPIGWLLAAPRAGVTEGVTVQLWVRRTWRGLGVGSALLGEVLVAAPGAEYREMCVDASPSMSDWLATRGFTREGTQTSGRVAMCWRHAGSGGVHAKCA